MQAIIQLSDFHVLLSDPNPEDNIKFVNLIDKIKKVNLGDKPILVYNGDLIHLKDVKKQVDKSKSKTWSDEKKWLFYMEKAFKHAEKYFRFLIDSIGIDGENIVICCGNHDMLQMGSKTIQVNCPRGDDVRIEENRFSLFSTFCERITGRKGCEHAQLFCIQGFNFLTQNTNWTDKYIGGVKQTELCINCVEVINTIIANKEKLDGNYKKNVFVSHAPKGDFCENGHYRYSKTKQTTVMPMVNKYFDLKLYGDKHTDYEDREESITGAPLKATEISAKIYEFDEEGNRHNITVAYFDGEWKTMGSEKDVQDILSISEDYIKGRANVYLFGSEQVKDLAEQIKDFGTIRSKPNWEYLNQLLCASADIKEASPRYIAVDMSKKDWRFIESLTDIIAESYLPIKVEGEPRLGKSVCLSILYMHMLNRFVSRAFPFIPLYFDIEKAISIIEQSEQKNLDRDSAVANEKIMALFNTWLSSGVEYANKTGYRLCCIIDGINKNRLYDNNRIEDSISKSIEEYTKGHNGKEPIIARVVNCIDTNGNATLAKVPQASIDVGYAVFFDPIRTNYAGKTQKLQKFISAFAKLQSATPAEEEAVLNNIQSLGITLVDTNLLITFWDSLKQKECKNYYELMHDFSQSKLTVDQQKNAAKACFDYTVCGKTYSNTFLADGVEMHNKGFDFVRTQRMVVNFLLANYYVEKIDKYHLCDVNAQIDNDDLNCLDRLYGHDVCFFIRKAISRQTMESVLKDFAEKHTEKLTFKGLSTLSYLIGRSQLSDDIKNELLNKAEQRIEGIVIKTEEDKFLREVAKRSIRLSKPDKEQTDNPMTQYIRTLIGDDYQRNVNRMFYLQFYGDRMDSNGEGIDYEPLKNGFDFFNTYHILASRLLKLSVPENWNGIHKDMHRLELFTLCDMVQMRIDIPDGLAKDRDGNHYQTPSFFYDVKYNNPRNDLANKRLKDEVKTIVDRYIDWFEGREDAMFISYLKLCKKSFDAASRELENGPLQREQAAFQPNTILKEVSKLKEVKRVGWNVNKTPTTKYSAKKIKSLQTFREVFETTLEHTFEAYIIAMFYLPDWKKDDFDKQKVLKMMLIHDLGEIAVGDILPCFEDYEDRRVKEDDFCRSLFVQSIHNEISNLNEYYELWDEWKSDSYNGKVAKDIDRLQRLFKMLQLLIQKEIEFTPARVKEFWNNDKKLLTEEGKYLYNVLIAHDSEFDGIRMQYGLKHLN